MCVCAAFKDQKGEGLKPQRASPPPPSKPMEEGERSVCVLLMMMNTEA